MQESLVQLRIGELVVRLADRLQRVIGHGAMVDAADVRIVGVLLVRASAQEEFLHFRLRVLHFGFWCRGPGILEDSAAAQSRAEKANPPIIRRAVSRYDLGHGRASGCPGKAVVENYG